MKQGAELLRSGGERGSLLVFFCFLLILIFAAVAFSIDSTRLISAAQEKQNTAGFVALAIVERYSTAIREANAPFSPEVHLPAFRSAVERGVEIGQQNAVTSRFVEKQLLRTADLLGADNLNSGGRLGEVQSGRWFDQIPLGLQCDNFGGLDDFNPQNRCPCGGVPCFARCRNELGCRAVETAQGGEQGVDGRSEIKREPPNAFRVLLRTASERGGGIPLLFARVLGQLESAVERQATAVIIPRHLVVLQDLSRSVAVDSHLYFQKTGIVSTASSERQPSQFAFRCEGNATGGASPNCLVATDANDLEPPFQPPVLIDLENNPRRVWNAMRSGDCRSGGPITRQCYRAINDSQGSLLVDRRVLGGGDDNGGVFGRDDVPQPYTTMLLAANQVLSTFREEQQVGDRVSLLGVGRDTGERRTLVLAEPRESDEQFNKMLRLTTPTAETLLERVQNRFFPGADGEYFDLPVGLSRAREALQRDPFYSSSQKHVFLITSGLTNCQRLEPRVGPPTEGVPQCSDSVADHLGSWKEAYDELLAGKEAGKFEGDGIALHVIQVGASTAPHTVAIRMPGETRCMRPDEVLDFGFSPVLPTAPSEAQAAFNAIGSGKGEPYFEVARALSTATRLTRGMYLPIRTSTQRCSVIPPTSCPPTAPRGFWSALDKACAVHPGPQSGQKSTEEVNLKGIDLATVIEVPQAAYDSQGRILCDPLCRDSNNRRDGEGPAQQLKRDVQAFLRTLPLSLVEESSR